MIGCTAREFVARHSRTLRAAARRIPGGALVLVAVDTSASADRMWRRPGAKIVATAKGIDVLACPAASVAASHPPRVKPGCVRVCFVLADSTTGWAYVKRARGKRMKCPPRGRGATTTRPHKSQARRLTTAGEHTP